ncbi:MAG TPA: AMP-binding protein [Ktedonobacteraceae bacterium]|nr:AMP-binding protein [Ktedonobacteraceae bacterium]
MSQQTPAQTIQEIEAIERIPLAERLGARSTYDLIRAMAARDPERLAIALPAGVVRSDRPTHLSAGALLKGVHQTANLLADLGVEATDVIAELLPNLWEAHLLFWGGQAAGIVCPIPLHVPVEQAIELLQAAQARVLVAPGPQVSRDLWQKAEAVRREVKSITSVLQVRGPGKERDAVYAFDALVGEYPADHLYTGREITLDDLAVAFPPGSATGTRGLVPLTHGNLLYTAWALGRATMLTQEEVLLGGLARFFQEG